MTKIGIIIGSNRAVSQSARIGDYVQKQLEESDRDTVCDIFSLRDLDIPLWTEDKWKPDSEMSKDWSKISTRIAECDGFVVVAPEWAGMVPPHLKNFLLMCDKGELAHKPAMLIAISSGMGGAYPIAELRMSGYKNNFLMWLPDHMILRNVGSLFTEEVPTELDISLTERLRYSLAFLTDMADAIKPVRARNQNLKKYKFGM